MAKLGDVLYFVNCPNIKAREHLTLSASKDDGRTWNQVGEIDPMGGYADMFAWNDRLYIYYERYSYDDELVREQVLAVVKVD